MTSGGFWANDETFILYSDLEEDVRAEVIRPVGGFVFDAEEFKNLPIGRTPFYIEGWLPKRGKAMLYAPAKTGKSYLCIQAGRCLGAGEFLLGLPTARAKTLYLQFELGEETLRNRLLETHKDYQGLWVGTSFNLKLDTPGGQERMLRAVQAVRPNVLIVDPLYKALMGDENEVRDIMKVLDFFDALIEQFNLSILLIHHAGKDLARRGRGSSVLEDWVDSLLQMKKISKEGEQLRVEIKPIMLRHANPDAGFEAVLVDGEFELADKTMTCKQLVAEMVRCAPSSVTPKELIELKLGSSANIYSALKELAIEGKLERSDRGQYRWRAK